MKTENLFLEGLNRIITFYIGQNQHDNFQVIDKGEPQDLWFHSKSESSCHVIAKIPDNINNREIKYIIKAGAILCKIYTNKLKKLKKTEIIYTEIKNIKKTNVLGCITTFNEKTIII